MKKLAYLSILLLCIQCRERYNVPFASPVTGYLVVEGFINPEGNSRITLNRTNKIEERKRVPESNALLQVQGEDNSLYYFSEADSGNYVLPSLQLNPSVKYRLHITTASGKEYFSSYQIPLITPPIDSISWIRQNGGLEIFVNAHDDNAKAQYYKWNFEETWEFHSAFKQNIVYVPVFVNGDVQSVSIDFYNNGKNNDSIYRCWQTRVSSSIRTGTTAGLSTARAYESLVFYPDGSEEMSVLYTINVRQHAIGKEAFEFYQKMKKNTESLGSIFDPLPSELKGNISNPNDPAELVIGFVDISAEQEQRKFISHDELPEWYYLPDCGLPHDYYSIAADTVLAAYNRGAFLTQGIGGPGLGGLAGFSTAPEECVRCTMRGTNVTPSFWP